MRLVLQFSQQVNSLLPSFDSRDCACITKDGHHRGSFHQRTIRYGYGKDFRHERANHKHDKLKFIQTKWF